MKRIILRPLSKILKLYRAVSRYPDFSDKERENLAVVLSGDGYAVRPELKLKIYELMLELRQKIERHFGMIVVLGWRREWDKKHAAIADATQNVFGNHHFNLWLHSLGEAFEVFKKTVDFDGAVLVSHEGAVLASGVYLDNVHPKSVAQAIHPRHTEDLSSAFGFSKKVHTRHLAAIAASYILKGTTIFVVSEEDSSVRIFEHGRIIWSTNVAEINKIVRENT